MNIFRIFTRGLVVVSSLALIYYFLHPLVLKGDEEKKANPKSIEYVFAPPMPSEPSFAGEKVPVEYHDIFERVDRELIVNSYYHSYVLLSFKRAGRYFPIIEPILKKNGIPDDFKYIAIIESGLANLISPAEAVGFWQFIESSADRFGLEVNEEVDERYDVVKSTEAACRYLKEAHSLLGSWTLAAASYNMGIMGVTRQLSRQKTSSYYDLYLNEETSRYLARAIAIKEIFINPRNYGFNLSQEDQYKPLKVKKVEISGRIENLIDFSIRHGYNYKLLKMYNPWLRSTKLTNRDGKKYTIYFPSERMVTLTRNQN